MAEKATSQATIAEKCRVGLRSAERILAEPAPPACEVAGNRREGSDKHRLHDDPQPQHPTLDPLSRRVAPPFRPRAVRAGSSINRTTSRFSDSTTPNQR
jgi:hypothetical protein